MPRFNPIIISQPSLEEIVADIQYNIDQLPQARLGCYSQEAITVSTESRLVELIIEGIRKIINWFKGLFSSGAAKARTSTVKDTEAKFKSAKNNSASSDKKNALPDKGVLVVTASHRIVDTDVKRSYLWVKTNTANVAEFTNAPAFKGVSKKSAQDFKNELRFAVQKLHVGTGVAVALPGAYRITTSDTDGLMAIEPVDRAPFVGEIPMTLHELCSISVYASDAAKELELLNTGLSRMEAEGKAIISKLQVSSGEDIAQVARSWTTAQGSIGRIATRLAGSIDTWILLSKTYRAAD